MKKRTIRNILFILFLIIIGIMPSFAINPDYQNNLNNVDIKKTGNGSLSLTIYTDKPYTEPLKVIKRDENRYVLLLPETSSTVTTNINSDIKKKTEGLVQNIDLKHYSYPTGDLNNGYTKVTITTDAPIENIEAKSVNQPKFNSSGSDKTRGKFVLPPLSASNDKPLGKPSIREEKAQLTKKMDVAQKLNKSQTQPNKQNKKLQKKVTKYNKKAIKSKDSEQESKEIKKPQEDKADTVASTNKPYKKTIQTQESSEINNKDTFPEPIVYEDVVSKTLKERFMENENLLLVIFAILLVPMLIVSNKIKQNEHVKTDKIIKEAVKVNQKKKKRKIRPTGYQQNLMDIMDNSNLSWQERYQLLKEEDQNNGIANYRKLWSNTLNILKEEPSLKNNTQEHVTEEKQNIIFEQEKIVTEPAKDKIQGHLSELSSSNKAVIESKTISPQMIAQVQLSENKGFYLTKFENKNFLIGYINSDVFVIKQLETGDIQTLSARLNETKGSTNIYLVKVGKNKLLVEVSEKMKLVLEL